MELVKKQCIILMKEEEKKFMLRLSRCMHNN